MSSLGLRWKQVASTASMRMTPSFPAWRPLVLHLVPNLTTSVLDASNDLSPATRARCPMALILAPMPQGGEGCRFKLPLPSPPWGRGAGGEGVKSGQLSLTRIIHESDKRGTALRMFHTESTECFVDGITEAFDHRVHR